MFLPLFCSMYWLGESQEVGCVMSLFAGWRIKAQGVVFFGRSRGWVALPAAAPALLCLPASSLAFLLNLLPPTPWQGELSKND